MYGSRTSLLGLLHLPRIFLLHANKGHSQVSIQFTLAGQGGLFASKPYYTLCYVVILLRFYLPFEFVETHRQQRSVLHIPISIGTPGSPLAPFRLLFLAVSMTRDLYNHSRASAEAKLITNEAKKASRRPRCTRHIGDILLQHKMSSGLPHEPGLSTKCECK